MHIPSCFMMSITFFGVIIYLKEQITIASFIAYYLAKYAINYYWIGISVFQWNKRVIEANYAMHVFDMVILLVDNILETNLLTVAYSFFVMWQNLEKNKCLPILVCGNLEFCFGKMITEHSKWETVLYIDLSYHGVRFQWWVLSEFWVKSWFDLRPHRKNFPKNFHDKSSIQNVLKRSKAWRLSSNDFF